MEPKQNHLMVGVFVIVAALGVLLFALWLADLKNSGEYTIYQTFTSESVNGLAVGSVVKYRGVDVGNVTAIEIPPRNPEKIQIIMRVDSDAPVTIGTISVLQMQGITGISYIELKGATANGNPIALKGNNKIPIIPSAPSEFRQIVDTVPDMLQKFTEVANKMGGFASEENQQRFASILSNLENFSTGVGAENEEGRSLIQDLQQATVELGNAAGSIERIASESRADTQRILKNSAETIDKIGKLTDNTAQLSQQGYNDLHQLLNELKKTARELQALSRNVREDPSSLLIPRKTDGVKLPSR